MLRRLARSFLVTTVAVAPVACRSTDDGSHAGSAAVPASLESGSSADPPEAPTFPHRVHGNPPPLSLHVPSTRVRTREGGSVAYKPADGVDLTSLTTLNPSDAQGMRIYVGFDDTCYVEQPMREPHPPLSTGERAIDNLRVDCPPSLNDAAWDDCQGATLARTAKGDCVCLPTSGNPPPPPMLVTCPKK